MLRLRSPRAAVIEEDGAVAEDSVAAVETAAATVIAVAEAEIEIEADEVAIVGVSGIADPAKTVVPAKIGPRERMLPARKRLAKSAPRIFRTPFRRSAGARKKT